MAPDRGEWVVVPRVTVIAQGGDEDCGRAALATALSIWGIAVDSRDRALAPPGGVTARVLRDEARRRGLASFVIEGTFDDLGGELDAGRPVIVGVVSIEGERRVPHFVVVVGRDARDGRWLVADPALGVRPVSSDALRDEWALAGWVTLVVLPHDGAAATPEDRRAVR